MKTLLMNGEIKCPRKVHIFLYCDIVFQYEILALLLLKLLPSAQFMEEISEYFQQHEQGLAAQELFRNQLTNLYETILYYI